VVVIVLTLVLNAARVHNGRDETVPADYEYEAGATEISLG